KLLRLLIQAEHLSPLEHANFTFSIEGISRVASHQLVRHRMASYTQQSQRYVNLKEPKYITPRSIAMSPFRAKFQEQASQAYQLYGEMVAAGVPMEDARFVLPEAADTQLVMTMNARELLHACSQRLCDRAQWEIRELFTQVKLAVSTVAPTIGDELKPKCYKLSYCDEMKSCGLFPTLADFPHAGG
ncbi:MAG: FAD-dependent thymidylate synthase, partial [Chloroflexota bacterium]